MNFLEMQSYIENHIKDSVNFPISTIFNEINKNLKWSCITLHDGLIGPDFEKEIKNSNLPENEKTRILKNPEHYLKSPVGGWKEFQTKKNIYSPSSKTRIGIVTGRINKIIVLDVDNIDKFKKFLSNHNIQFDTNTFTVQTGKGGFHYYYIYPDDGIVYYCIQDKDNGIDVRAELGFVLAFGSLHPNGNYYRIVNPAPIAPAPQWLLDYVHQRNLNRKKGNIMKQNANTKKLTDEEFNNIFKQVDVDLEYLDTEIQNLIKNGCALHHRSEAIGKILFHMIVEGYSYEEIKSVCFNKSYGISEKFYEREATFFDNEYKSSVNEVNRLGLKIKTKSSKNKVKFDPVIAGINIINSFEYYITPDNMIYAKHKLDNNENEYINLESKQFAPIVSKTFREIYCKSISKQNLDLVLLEAPLVAKKIAKQADSLCRFLQQKDRLIYYTGDKDNFIVIDSNGYRLENNLDIVVKKSEYIKPIKDIKMNMRGTENLNKFLNILDITNDYYRHTLILTLIGYLFSNISTPVLYLYGEGGSSKT